MDMMMGMGTDMFQTTNRSLARAYWYVVAGVVGLLVAIRCINYYQNSLRLRTRASTAQQFPTKPANAFWQTWATLTAVVRETSYPQLYVPFRFLTWLTPPPAGRILVLLVYWAMIIGFMTADAIISDVNFWERIGFRNAWVTVTQLPLLYLLAGKTSIIGTLTGTSHERLNWLHRWVGRTMFVSASVHGWHFYTEYARADLADLFFETMPMGKYGVGAWALLLWAVVTGIAPLRHWCYEFFVVQHILTAVLLLWVVHVHVPSYAQYNVWFAIAALCFDRAARLALLVWQNVKLARPHPSRCKGGQRIGHQAQLRAVGNDITVLTIKDVHFRWRAGQHVYLWAPAMGPLEQHPYTVACSHKLPGTCICNSIQLVVRKHGGFSKRLHDRARKLEASGNKDAHLTVFLTGPYGAPPRWDIYETLVLLSASTGASFTLPILESVLLAKHAICTKRVDFLLAAKSGDEIGYYVERLHELIALAENVGIELKVCIAVTGEGGGSSHDMEAKFSVLRQEDHDSRSGSRQQNVSSPSSTAPFIDDEPDCENTAAATGACCQDSAAPAGHAKSAEMSPERDIEKTAAQTSGSRHRPHSRGSARSTGSTDSHVHYLSSRPDVGTLIRSAVEATGGETSVVVCGGKSLVSRTRNCVARLSDERAVHKGTGAQGIHLYVEEFNF